MAVPLVHLLNADRAVLLTRLLLRQRNLLILFRLRQRLHGKFLIVTALRRFFGKDSRQLSCIQHRQLMQCPRRRHVKQLHLPVIFRIFFFRRIKKQHRIELKTFRICHREHHHALAELCRLEILLHNRHVLFQLPRRIRRFCLIPAYNGNRLISLRLPCLDCLNTRGEQRRFIVKCFFPHRRSVPQHRLHRIDRKVPMPQNLVCKIGDLHRIPVTLPQNAERIVRAGQNQLFQLLPVVQAVGKMDILRRISHNGIRTVTQTVMKHLVRHHPEILRLVDDHMARLAHGIVFLDPLIEVCQRRQIIDIKGVFRHFHRFSFLRLLLQKLQIEIKNGSPPFSISKIFLVFPLQRLFFARRKRHFFSRNLVLKFCQQDLVQHAHLSFHGKCGLLPAIVINILGVQKQCSRFFQPHRLPRNLLCLVRTAEIFQIEKPAASALYAVFLIRAVDGVYRVLCFVPVLVQKPDEKLLHRHLTDAVHIEFRQNAGNVVQQNAVASNDIEILRPEVLLVIIEDVRNPVHRHRRLSGTSHALYDQICLRGSADNEVLLLLDRRNDLTEHRFFVLRQILCQQLIVRYHIGIKKVFQMVIFNLIRPLSFQINRKSTL